MIAKCDELHLFHNPADLRRCVPRQDLHLHTNFTDGTPTVADYARRAVEIGMDQIGFPEHCNGRSTWLEPFTSVIAAERERWAGHLTITWGIEAKAVDYSGNLAAPPHMSAAAEYIYGAFHSSLSATKFTQLSASEAIEMEYRATLGMIRARSCHAIAHPGGLSRKYHGEFPRHFYEDLAKEAASNEVALEINPGYNANIDEHIAACEKYSCKVVLGSNAHQLDELGLIMRGLERMVHA